MPIDEDLASWNDRMYGAHATPYHGVAGRIQRARVATVMRLAEITTADSVLEIGCEAGHLLVEAPPCKRLAGADISARALADAESLFHRRGRPAELHQLDAQRPLPFERGEFDVIICSDTLEHVPEPLDVLRSIHACADVSTRIILSVPIEAPKLLVKRALGRLGLLEILFPGIEPGQSRWHLTAFSRRMLLELTRELFRLERGRSVWGCHYVARFSKTGELAGR